MQASSTWSISSRSAPGTLARSPARRWFRRGCCTSPARQDVSARAQIVRCPRPQTRLRSARRPKACELESAPPLPYPAPFSELVLVRAPVGNRLAMPACLSNFRVPFYKRRLDPSASPENGESAAPATFPISVRFECRAEGRRRYPSTPPGADPNLRQQRCSVSHGFLLRVTCLASLTLSAGFRSLPTAHVPPNSPLKAHRLPPGHTSQESPAGSSTRGITRP